MTEKPNHNIPDGPVSSCQICGSKSLEIVLDLGHQPICDSLLDSSSVRQPEITYPLRQVWCPDCTLNQLDFVVNSDIVYPPNYHYKTGVTKELVIFQKTLAEEIVQTLKIKKGSLVCDIGSNDGTLLKSFNELGMNILGIEPTNIAKFAQKNGVPTIQSPFNPEIAQNIIAKHGKASVATATNVFAHMSTLGDVIEGLEILLKDDGYFCLENHYMTAIKDGKQYDTIYHEHLRSYSLHSIIKLFSYYNFTVVNALKTSRYGGNIRVYIAKGKGHDQSVSVQKLLDEELAIGLKTSEYYDEFRDETISLKNDLVSTLLDLKRKGFSVVGNSFPARASTLLNFCGIGTEILPYIAEQPTSLKLGHFTPGGHIPIVNNQRLIDDQPDYVLLLAWHLADPIMRQLRERGLKSKFIVPMPTVKIIE